jgi:hypothetical protein
VWVSPEALLVAAPVLAAFGVLWVAEGARGLPAAGGSAAAQGLRASLGFALVVAAAVACEHPPSAWLDGEYDKVSAQHVLLGVLAVAVFGAAGRIAGGPARRTALGGAAAGGAAGLLLLFRPQALHASLASVDGAAAAHFISMVSEMRPIDLSSIRGLLGDAPVALAAAPAALLTFALAAPGWRREGRLAAAVPLALALAAALPATLLHRRFAIDLAAPACLLAAGLPVLALGLRRPKLRLAAAVLGMAAAFGTPFLALLGAAATGPERETTPQVAVAEEDGGVAALAALGRRDPPMAARGAADPVLLANSINSGPELAWRTPFRLVGAPYHRGGDAIADTFAFFGAADDAAARAVAERRRASMVLLCAPWLDEAAAGASLLGRLRRGEAPGWLAPVPLPGAPAGVRLFAVRPPPPGG